MKWSYLLIYYYKGVVKDNHFHFFLKKLQISFFSISKNNNIDNKHQKLPNFSKSIKQHIEHLFVKRMQDWKKNQFQKLSRNLLLSRYLWKSFWSYSGPHFPAFGLNTERYSVSVRIQSKCGKMWTRIIPNTKTFCAVIVH